MLWSIFRERRNGPTHCWYDQFEICSENKTTLSSVLMWLFIFRNTRIDVITHFYCTNYIQGHFYCTNYILGHFYCSNYILGHFYCTNYILGHFYCTNYILGHFRKIVKRNDNTCRSTCSKVKKVLLLLLSVKAIKA